MEPFYSQWHIEGERLLNEMLSVPNDRPDLHIPLIFRALSHYNQYYDRKSELADRDVFQAFSTSWLTPIERAFVWLGGVRPGVIFRFLPSELGDDKRREVEQLKQETVERGTELERKMQQVEEIIIALTALAAVHGGVKNGEARGELTQRMADMTRAVFDEAERLRKWIVTRNVEMLDTAQAMQFLAGVLQFHVGAYQLGLQYS